MSLVLVINFWKINMGGSSFHLQYDCIGWSHYIDLTIEDNFGLDLASLTYSLQLNQVSNAKHPFQGLASFETSSHSYEDCQNCC